MILMCKILKKWILKITSSKDLRYINCSVTILEENNIFFFHLIKIKVDLKLFFKNGSLGIIF